MTDYDIDQVIINAIRTGTGKEVGYCAPPDPHPQIPYVIVTPQTSPGPVGDLGSRTSNATQNYTIECVAEDGRGVRWLQAKVLAALAGAVVPGTQWVVQTMSGAIVPCGDALYSASDTYQARI